MGVPPSRGFLKRHHPLHPVALELLLEPVPTEKDAVHPDIEFPDIVLQVPPAAARRELDCNVEPREVFSSKLGQ